MPTEAAPALDITAFRSPVYGYALHPPEGWDVTAATEGWRGTDPWGATEADHFDSGIPARRLTVVSTQLPKGMTGDVWIEAHSQGMPVEFETDGGPHCVFRRGTSTMFIPGASVSIIDGVIDGRPAQLRAICGHITGSVTVGDRVFQFSLFVDRTPHGDRSLFDTVMATVDFDPPAPASTFVSARYGFRINVPGDWTAAPAAQQWTGVGRPTDAAADAFVGPSLEGSPRLMGAARTKPDDISEDRFVADVAPLATTVRVDGPAVHCVFGDRVVERGPIPPWSTEVIGGHRAQVRSMCDTVDAVVVVGNRGYVFSLVSGQETRGDLERFRELIASVRFDDGRETFVSDGYGYSVRIPAGDPGVGWAGRGRDADRSRLRRPDALPSRRSR
jgi:hypothetical protein